MISPPGALGESPGPRSRLAVPARRLGGLPIAGLPEQARITPARVDRGEDAPIHAAMRAEDTAGGGGVAGDGAWSWGEDSLRPALVFEGFNHGRGI